MTELNIVKLAEDDRGYSSALLQIVADERPEELKGFNDLRVWIGTPFGRTHLRIWAKERLKALAQSPKGNKIKTQKFQSALKLMCFSVLVNDPNYEMVTEDSPTQFVCGFDYNSFKHLYDYTLRVGKDKYKQFCKLVIAELNHPGLITGNFNG